MRSLLIAAAAAGVLLAAPALAQTGGTASLQTQVAQTETTQTQTAPAAQDFSARRHSRHWGWRRPWGWRHRHWRGRHRWHWRHRW